MCWKVSMVVGSPVMAARVLDLRLLPRTRSLAPDRELLAENRDSLWRSEPKTNLIPVNPENGHDDVVADPDVFSDSSRKYQHWTTPAMPGLDPLSSDLQKIPPARTAVPRIQTRRDSRPVNSHWIPIERAG